MRKLFGFALTVSLIAGISAPKAEEFSYSDRSRTGTFTSGAAFGFTLDPDLFLFGVEGDYFVHHNIAVGPMVQFGMDDDVFLLSPTANVRGVFDLPTYGFGRRIKPFGQFGVGFSYVDVDAGPFNGDDTSFLINFGFGADVYLTTNIVLGTNVLFNITPNFNDNFYFAWQFITARYHF